MEMNKTLASVILLTGSIAATSASAGTLITEWAYELDAGFTDWSETTGINPVTGTEINPLLSKPSKLSWGIAADNSADQSSIAVGETNGHKEGFITTNDPAVNTVLISHDNVTLKNTSATLLTAVLTDILTLTPSVPAGPTFPGLPLEFDINFFETPNLADPLDCDVSGAAIGCPDIFVFDVTGGDFNTDDPSNLFITNSFVFDDYLYSTQLFVQGLAILEDAACVAAGVEAGCIGLTTAEKTLNEFQISLGINAREVSAPASLALLGLGLLGMGRLRRKS